MRYLDSPFDLRYPDLRAERRALLDADGRIYRDPLIEPVPLYESSGQTFATLAQTLLGGTWSANVLTDLADFAVSYVICSAGFNTKCLGFRFHKGESSSSYRSRDVS